MSSSRLGLLLPTSDSVASVSSSRSSSSSVLALSSATSLELFVEAPCLGLAPVSEKVCRGGSGGRAGGSCLAGLAGGGIGGGSSPVLAGPGLVIDVAPPGVVEDVAGGVGGGPPPTCAGVLLKFVEVPPEAVFGSSGDVASEAGGGPLLSCDWDALAGFFLFEAFLASCCSSLVLKRGSGLLFLISRDFSSLKGFLGVE